MTTLRHLIDVALDDYRASDSAIRNGKREQTLLEFFKWEAIRDGIRKIDMEEAV